MDKKNQERLILLFPFLLMLIILLLIWLAPRVAVWFVAFLILAPVLYGMVGIGYYELVEKKQTASTAPSAPLASESANAPAARPPAPADDRLGLVCPYCGARALSFLRKWTLWTEQKNLPCQACGQPVHVKWWHRLRASGLSMFLLLGYAAVTPFTDRGQHGVAVLGLAGVLFILLESFSVPLSRMNRWDMQRLEAQAHLSRSRQPAKRRGADGGDAGGSSGWNPFAGDGSGGSDAGGGDSGGGD